MSVSMDEDISQSQARRALIIGILYGSTANVSAILNNHAGDLPEAIRLTLIKGIEDNLNIVRPMIEKEFYPEGIPSIEAVKL